MPELKRVFVTSNREISPGVHWLSWKRDDSFIAGQVLKIAMGQADVPRIYSICSGDRDEEISVLFNIKEGGFLTPRLSVCKPGDPIYVSQAYGTFTGDDAPAWWIASGTGIAPFYSMARSGILAGKRLIHGVRSAEQFYFDEFFITALGDRYIRCCSGESHDQVFHGRVTAYLAGLKEIPVDNKYYLCGKALMVVEVRDLLIDRGVPYEKIHAEIYF